MNNNTKPVILCVDDEKMLLLALKHQLKRQFGSGYHIETASSGEEALEIVDHLLAEHLELPVIISDQIMPGMTGDELLQQIHASLPKTLKILLTGETDIQAIGNAVNKANLYRYISKPWVQTDLCITVTEALRSYFQEKKLSAFYADLEKKVAERTRELQQKNEFLSIAVHDLKNPISAIQGFAEMLKYDFDDIPDEVIDVASQISISARQMFELVRNLLEINAIESSKMNISLSVVDIKPTLQGIVNQYIERAKKKDILLQMQCDDEQYQAKVDINLLRQVLDNLISNAIKYSPYGKSVFIRLNQNSRFVRCEVQDEGPGLSDEDQEKLFNEFTRLTPKPTGGEHSTGLGLFIVKKLVESMQGKVWCESILGQGTTFRVEFPIK